MTAPEGLLLVLSLALALVAERRYLVAERKHRRRTAPYWVRQLPDQSLHGLTGKLARIAQNPDLNYSERQSWLAGQCFEELEWRAWNDRRNGIRSCVCEHCCSPWQDLEDVDELGEG